MLRTETACVSHDGTDRKGLLTEPFIDLVSDLMRFVTSNVEVEMVGAPLLKPGVLAAVVKIEIDAGEIAAVLDCGIFELKSRLHFAVVLIIVLVVSDN